GRHTSWPRDWSSVGCSSDLRSVDWARLLTLAEEHGVAGHLTACLRGPGEDLIPPEIKPAIVDRQRAQIFFTLRLTAELFRILDRSEERRGGKEGKIRIEREG